VELSVTGTVFGTALHAAPVVPHAVWVAAPGVGVTGLGAPVFTGAALVLAAGCAGLGAAELAALESLDPLEPLDPDAELEGVGADLGALEPPPESGPDPLDGELDTHLSRMHPRRAVRGVGRVLAHDRQAIFIVDHERRPRLLGAYRRVEPTVVSQVLQM